MKPHSLLMRGFATLAISVGSLLYATSRVAAADGTWTNTSGGAWTNTNNWSGFVVPSGTDSVANLASVNITANSTVTNSTSGTLIGTFLFGDTSGAQTWGVTGGSFTLSTSSGTPTISNSVTTTFSSALGGSQGMLKDGTATLILGGANTYTGNTILSAGTLRVGTSDVLPDGSVVVFANNTNNKELTVFSATETIGGLSSSGGAGTILVQNNRATNSGILNLNVAAATSLSYDGIIRDAAAGVAVNNLNITKSGTGTQVFSGGASVSYSGATTVSNGVLEFSGATVNNNTAISVTSSNAAIRFNIASGNLVRTNTISGAGGLAKAGTNSALTLSNDNTYTGSTVLEDGFIRLGASDRIADASVLRFATTNDARFQMTGFSETLGGLDSGSSSGTQVVEGSTNAAATLTLVVGSGSFTYNGSLRDSASGTNANNLALVKNGAGTQVLSGGNSRVAYSGTTTINAGTLEFAGSTVNNNSAITLAGGNAVIRFNNDTNSVTRSNTISGLGGLEKSGAGTLTLSAPSSYEGNTTVNDGVLLLATNGSLRLVVGGSGTNNQLRGSGSAQLEGSLLFDLAGAATNADATWVIISNSLAVAYGPNFFVSGFNGAGGNWTNTTNGVSYVFSQSSGVLSVQSTSPVGNYASWISYWTNLYPGFTNTAGTDDPDGDSFDNNEEFAFDGNPTVGTPAFLTASTSGTNAVFNYVARKDPPGGVTYQVEGTTNLATGLWTNAAVTVFNSANQTGLTIPADYERKEFTVPLSSREFYRVRAIIATGTGQKQFQLTNQGMRGYSVDKVAQAWPKLLQDGPSPDAVVLLVGTNDMINSAYLTPLDIFRDQYGLLVNELIKTSKYLAVVTLPPCVEELLFLRHDPSLYEEPPNQRLRQANTIIREIASQKGVPVVDLDLIFVPGTWEEGNPQGLLTTVATSGRPDGVHPNAAGARKIGEAVAECIKHLGLARGAVTCLGDSITYGGGLNGAGTTQGETYPAVVSQLLNNS